MLVLLLMFTHILAAPQGVTPPEVKIEVREGGGCQAPPHPVIISIRSDGLVKTTRGEFRVPAQEVHQLVTHLERLGAFNLPSGDLQEEVIKAGEAPAGVRGGSGVYTLCLTRGDKSINVRLNQPDSYSETRVKAVRIFQKALHAIRKFAKEVEQKHASQQRQQTP